SQLGSERCAIYWKADTRPLQQAIDSIRAVNPAALHSIADIWILCALAERDAASAQNALVAAGDKSIVLSNENVLFRRPFVEALIARMTRDDPAPQSPLPATRLPQA